MASLPIRPDCVRANPTLQPVGLLTIERACRHHGIPPSRFGGIVLGDPRLVSDMKRGRELRPATQAKVQTFLAGLGGEL